jgi:hypothetical protein
MKKQDVQKSASQGGFLLKWIKKITPNKAATVGKKSVEYGPKCVPVD